MDASTTTGTWDTNSGNTPWLNPSSSPASFANFDTINFSQDAASPVTVTVAPNLSTYNVNVSHNAGTYILTGAKATGDFTKTNGGTVVLASTNDFGNVTIQGGVVETTAAVNPLGNYGLLSIQNNATWKISTSTTLNRPFEVGSGGATLDVAGTELLTMPNVISGTQTLTKTGTGTVLIAGTSAFTGNVEINQGRLIVADPLSATAGLGDLNATNINVNNGGTFQFGSVAEITGENPDLPANTAVNIKNGGVVDWYVGESLGFVNMEPGATLNIVRGGPGIASAIGSTFTGGTIVGAPGGVRSFSIAAASIVLKNGPDTVTVTNTNFDAAGKIAINEGVFSTDSTFSNTGALDIGSSFNNATLQLRTPGIQIFPAAKLTTLGSAGGTIDVSQATGDVRWDGVITGGTLNKIGPGSLQLNAANTYSGPTNVNAGTLAVAPTALPTSTTANVSAGATLSFLSDATTASIMGLNLAANGNLQFNLNGNPTVMPLSVTGNDGLGGSLFVPQVGGKITLSSSTPLSIGTFALLDYDGTLTNFSDLNSNLVLPPRTIGNLVNNTVDTRIDVNITSFDTVKWTGVGAAAWEVNPATQNWKLNTAGTATSYLEGDLLTFDDSATGTTDITLAGTVNPGSMLFNNSTKNYGITGAGAISGSGVLTKSGTGTVTINSQYNSTGAVTVNDGTLNLNAANTITGLTINAGTVNSTVGSTLGPVSLVTGSLTLGGANQILSLANSGGTATLTDTNTIGTANISGGTTIFAAANTIGAITFSGGTIETRATNGIGLNGTLTATNNGLLHATTTSQTTNKALSVGAGGITIQVDDTLNFTIGGTTSNSGVDTGTMTKTGTGTLTLTGGSSFTGTLDIQAGTVILKDATLGTGTGGDLDSALIIVNNGTKFQLGGDIGVGENPDFPASTFITTKTGGLTEIRVGEDSGGFNLEGGTFLLSGGNYNITNASIDSTITSGTITSTGAVRSIGGARGIVKTTSGTVTVTDTTLNASGGISILEGTLSTNAGFNTGADTGSIKIGDTSTAATLQLTSAAALSIANKPVIIGTGGGTIDVTNAATVVTFANTSPFSGDGTLQKTGAGTLRLAAVNTMTGPINVTAGRLDVSGSTTSTTSITLSAGTTLGGAGTINGAITMAPGTFLAPGNAAGALTVANGIDLSNAVTYQWQMTGNVTATPVTDVLNVTGGTLTLGGTSALTLDFTGVTGGNGPDSASTYWDTAKTWKIVDVSNGVVNSQNIGSITNPTFGRGTFSTSVGIDADAGDIFLVFTPVVAGASIWQGANNDNWTAATSWTGVVPSSATAEAKFTTTGGTTANLDTDQSVNKLTFDSTVDHAVSGSGKLTLTGTTPSISTAATNTGTQTVATNLDLAAGTTVKVDGGTLNLNAPSNAALGAGVTATVASGATLNLGGAGNALSNGTTTHANVTNNGTLAATTAGKRVGNIDGTGTTTVTAAGASLTASHIRQNNLTIGSGNTVTVAPNGGNTGVSVVNSLSVAGGATPTGTLDLKDNDLIVKNTDLTTATTTHALINAQVKNASNGFVWDQTGITSSTVQTDLANGTPTALGILLNNDGSGPGGKLFYGDGTTLPQFDGQTVDENAVLVKYTWLGDSDLNGVVNVDDFTYFQLGYSGGAPYTGWAFGDYDYNGVVDVDDFTYFQLGFGGQSGPALLTAGSAGLNVTAVPEPGTWAVLIGLVGATALRARRWSKKKESLL